MGVIEAELGQPPDADGDALGLRPGGEEDGKHRPSLVAVGWRRQGGKSPILLVGSPVKLGLLEGFEFEEGRRYAVKQQRNKK